jgi:Zn-finger nucleic acid-binding protein
MAKCTNCGAPLPQNSVVCQYCNSRNAVDLTGIHEYTTHKPEQPRTCPICQIEMDTISIAKQETFYIEKCRQCHGLFFDTGELEALLDKSVQHIQIINYKRLVEISESSLLEQSVTYRKCPVCTKIMNRVNFGTRSGVIIDVCHDHGVFLDAGELRQLMEWRKAGGQYLHEQTKVEFSKLQEKKEQEKRRQLQLEDQEDYSRSWGTNWAKVSRGDRHVLHSLGSLLSKLF